MKVAVYSDTKASEIPTETDSIHLVRPLGRKKIEKLLKRCPGCREISLSKSCLKRLGPKTKSFLKKAGVELSIESRRGRAIGISLEKMLQAIELRKDYQSLREIERLTEIPKSTVHYLVKYAHRDKVKKGDSTVYLK
ncbi:MAG: hypothetical protein QGI60_00470 [archaeon]|jgi:hypothetical protein|nr:hypothetical protein [archaeon]